MRGERAMKVQQVTCSKCTYSEVWAPPGKPFTCIRCRRDDFSTAVLEALSRMNKSPMPLREAATVFLDQVKELTQFYELNVH